MSTETPENTEPTIEASSALDFKKRREEAVNGRPIVLGSGLTVFCKRPKPSKLIKDGYIPADVAAALNQAAQTQQNGGAPTTKQLEKVAEYNRLLVRASVVNPVIVADGAEPDYDKGEIAISDLEDMDISQITNFVQTGVAELQFFRNQRQSDTARLDLQKISRATA